MGTRLQDEMDRIRASHEEGMVSTVIQLYETRKLAENCYNGDDRRTVVAELLREMHFPEAHLDYWLDHFEL